MLKSKRLAVLPIDSYDLESELSIVDRHEYGGDYDTFTFGSWSSHVLANGTGSDTDTAFRPHDGRLTLTELGKQLPGVMSLVTDSFPLDRLQWVRVFSLRDGLISPHVDFLEFSEPGTRLQVPLRTSEESLHSENDSVYHIRRGEVWKIHSTDPHSARSTARTARLSLCLDFADSEEPLAIRNDVPATEPVRIVERPEPTDAELRELIGSGRYFTPTTMRPAFRRFAELHFERRAHAAAAFDWYVEAARLTGDASMVAKARAFRTYCIEKRGDGETFDW
ncbi:MULTISPECIES: putative nonproteinogenic amino acid hydroxylase [unclassified Streptomyces]|uniref:putative nonproteinogenic amino acid hydroxylase n=1 Tax=unclassified Streptomyces TaxID=2593676 RepID=UPI001F04803C|nr:MULTISPECIES: putative nonproteinogenic amino acid hydroxylase [unclassified Streptomyces]MCH0564639.1 putative nonproteinogenic amino acid hydroxylase [Streptomyces sp. MUM 2J]MCH0570339.1 putative nonproteinogenic amino acid hydroxylase [Streptomyces sp. MUM 136J]